MLMRPRNVGLAVYDVHSHKRIQDAIVEGAEVTWPAVVSRETYDAVLALLADPARHTGKKRARMHRYRTSIVILWSATSCPTTTTRSGLLPRRKSKRCPTWLIVPSMKSW
jgi:hypothetical protein